MPARISHGGRSCGGRRLRKRRMGFQARPDQEFRMSNDECLMNDEARSPRRGIQPSSPFGFRQSDFFRHSSLDFFYTDGIGSPSCGNEKGTLSMNYGAEKQRFDGDGFVIVRQFLTPGELTELTNQLDRYIRDIVPGLSDAHAFYHERGRPETLKQMQFMQVDNF